MPQKRGIVKSGNTGNSSKPSKVLDTSLAKTGAEQPLFPPGFKYPLSLLHERCQKEGWEKPVVDTVHRSESGFSFVVTLTRLNKKTSERETVRLAPPQPYCRQSAVEARHWGATYALYRFCNRMHLNRTLPPGPRDYWNELAVEHKSAADHLSWMYAADPFAAQRAVKERQENTAQKREAVNNNKSRKPGSVTGLFKDSPEARMATSLRQEVEKAIKKGFSLYGDEVASALDEQTVLQVSDQLRNLGFKEAQIKKASSFLSEPSTLLRQLLQSSSALGATTDYLLLSVPECDLPPKFLPGVNSSNPFVSSAYSGTSDIKKRWVEEKAVKEAGFPIHIVQELTAEPAIIDDWPMLVAKLGIRLLGVSDVITQSDITPFSLDEVEFVSLGGERQGDGHYALPSFTAPITLHILFDAGSTYPRADYCPMYITSDTVPAYVRLHILSRILSALGHLSEEADTSFGMTLMRLLDEEWAHIEDHGPPDVNDVLGHIMAVRRESAPVLPFVPFKQHESRAAERRPNHQPQVIPSSTKCVSKTIIEARRRLPAFKVKANFLHILSKNQVVIVVGETGSGKTTQLPQYILESFEDSTQSQSPYVIVTQPRRISAISVANRVSEERGNDGTVGYAVRGQSKQGKSTRLLFCTTGVVLRRLNSGDKLQNVSHIVVDEVHERSLDGDFLLLALKQLLNTHSKLKIVLMSATINHEVFSRYFGGAPILPIPGITYPVFDEYLEDIIPLIGYIPSSSDNQQKENDESWSQSLRQTYGGLSDQALAAIDSIANSKTIDYQLISSLVIYLIENQVKAGILIFLPGAHEIKLCLDAVKARLDPEVADIFPLHASLPIEEQNHVFVKTTKWKIIASTNVAETSITVDDIVYVIDTGKVKETRYSPAADLTRIEEVLATRAASRQRRGRAGRMQPGVCYKLYTRHVEKEVMEGFPTPEILRVPLEQVFLSAKLMNENEDTTKLLGLLVDPPDSATIERAWSNLLELGAINSSNKLTPLGRHMAMLPLDVRLAKMLVLGTIFHCLSPALSITALMSTKPLFVNPESMREEASSARRRFAVDNSDLLTDLEAFNQCQKLRRRTEDLKSFCKEHFISMTTLQEIFTLRREFCAALEECGFVPPQCNPSDRSLNVNSENLNLLKAIILGGLWPRVGRVYLPKSAIKFDKIQAGAVQRDNSAKEFKVQDLKEGRVFIHPASILFNCTKWKSSFVAYFRKYQSSKVFLTGVTEVPMYALLLFGGPVAVDHIEEGLTVGNKDALIRLRAWPRIGVLVNQLRQLLDLLLANCIEDGSILRDAQNHPVIVAMLSLLSQDGMIE